MRAIILDTVGQPLQLKDVPIPSPDPKQILMNQVDDEQAVPVGRPVHHQLKIAVQAPNI